MTDPDHAAGRASWRNYQKPTSAARSEDAKVVQLGVMCCAQDRNAARHRVGGRCTVQHLIKIEPHSVRLHPPSLAGRELVGNFMSEWCVPGWDGPMATASGAISATRHRQTPRADAGLCHPPHVFRVDSKLVGLAACEMLVRQSHSRGYAVRR